MASLLPWGSFHAQANYSRRCETTLIRIDQLLINCLLYLPPAGEWIWPCWHFISSLQEMRDNKSYTSKTRNIKSVNRNQFQGLYGGAAFQVRLITYIDVKNVFTFFFYFGHVFYVFNVFFIFQTFFILKKRWQSSERKQINKKHFQNNSNDIQWVHK